jgi:3-hydroxyacyl-[acyl-carrier-protein] dehydratase
MEDYSILEFSSTENSIDAKVTLQETSMWFNGHFPDQPILPGVGQLVILNQLISKFHGKEVFLSQIKRAKFKKLIEPMDILQINIEIKEDHYSYKIKVSDDLTASGLLFSKGLN